MTTEEIYKKIKEGTFMCIAEERVRAYELHSGDVLYCNPEFMKEFRYNQDLLLGQKVNLNGAAALVVKVIKNKKYPNKK